MTMAAAPFSSMYDGFIGLAPYGLPSDTVRDADRNFMYNLKYGQNLIDHLVASVFVSSHVGGNTTSHIKFGSYDPQAIKSGESLQLMKTRGIDSWSVELTGASMIDATFQFERTPTYVIYEPQLPYIYLPEDDFLTFQGLAATFYSLRDLHCNNRQRGTCHFDTSCDTVRNDYTLVDTILHLGDSDGAAYEMVIPFDKLLVPGNELGDTRHTCYIGIFRSREIDEDTWYIGNQAMGDHYAVFDLTPADEEGKDYIQFGIAQKVDGHSFQYEQGSSVNIAYHADGTPYDPTEVVEEEVVDYNPFNDKPRDDNDVKAPEGGHASLVVMFLLIALVACCAAGCLRHLRKRKREQDEKNDMEYEIRRETLLARNASKKRRESLRAADNYKVKEESPKDKQETPDGD
jgi:hypothetical protein